MPVCLEYFDYDIIKIILLLFLLYITIDYVLTSCRHVGHVPFIENHVSMQN